MRGVYVIHNSVTGRNYVGSSRCVEGRIKTHLSALRHKRHHNEGLQNEFDLYGEESFSFLPLFDVQKAENLTSVECFVMKVLRSQENEFGYNRDNFGTAKGIDREGLRQVHKALLARCFPNAYSLAKSE